MGRDAGSSKPGEYDCAANSGRRNLKTNRKPWLVAALVFLPTGIAFGQSAQQIADATKWLSAPQRQTIDRLGEFGRLPDGHWRVHPGDIPHGEGTTLDDSAWPLATPGSEYSEDAVWFRQWFEVPKDIHGYDLTGARIWFQFQARTTGRDAVTEIVYFNGRRVALGENLERLVLIDEAKPGDRVLVAVKLLATSLNKRFQGAITSIEFAQGRPNPQELHDEFLSAALLTPSLSKNVADDQATLAKAIGQVDVGALEQSGQRSADLLSTRGFKRAELGNVYKFTGRDHRFDAGIGQAVGSYDLRVVRSWRV